MKLIRKIRAMQKFADEIKEEGKIIAFVPTMGYLHEGHLSLMRIGKSKGDILVVSIFVNPTQFGPQEDFNRYPKDLEMDKKLLKSVGCDVLFYPSANEMYPEGYQTYVNVEEVSTSLCGASRPGHFRGVTTVVAKLFNIVKPHIAIFGEKDYQQLKVIEQMVKDLNIDVEILGYPAVREKDGLAMSSRNKYLNKNERQLSLSIYSSIQRAKELFEDGERKADKILKEVTSIVNNDTLIDIDYIKICDAEQLKEINTIEKDAVLAIAVKIGKTRLIDNFVFKTDE